MSMPTTHNDRLKSDIQRNPERFAKEMLEGGSYGWNTNLWPLFKTMSEFIAVITMAASLAPSEFILRIPYICAYLTKLNMGHVPGDDVWNFLPEEMEKAWKLGQSQFGKIEPIFYETMRTLSDGERIHPHVIRLLPIHNRRHAHSYCKRIDEGVEMSIHLLVELEQHDSWAPGILSKLLQRMTPQNAPYIYTHALASGFDPNDGEHGYWKTTTVKSGRHHTGHRGDTFSQMAPETTKTPRHTRVRDAWFYKALRNRVTECGWAFVKPTLNRRGDRLEDIQMEARPRHFVWTTFPMPIMSNAILMAYLAHGLDVIVPASRVWDPNHIETRLSGEAITFAMPVVFDAPYGYDRSDGDWTEFNAPKTGR